MTYTIQVLRNTWQDGEMKQQWEYLESFEDKELAEKELRNLDRAWVASGTFRLTQTNEIPSHQD